MSVRWTGLAEYKADLAQMPEACAAEAGQLVETIGTAVKEEIAHAYPRLTGDLGRQTTVTPLVKKGLVVSVVVKNPSKLAAIVENGSEARQYVTVNGVKHLTGRMPALHVFVPRIERARRTLTEQLTAMVLRHGATKVTDAG